MSERVGVTTEYQHRLDDLDDVAQTIRDQMEELGPLMKSRETDSSVGRALHLAHSLLSDAHAAIYIARQLERDDREREQMIERLDSLATGVERAREAVTRG